MNILSKLYQQNYTEWAHHNIVSWHVFDASFFMPLYIFLTAIMVMLLWGCGTTENKSDYNQPHMPSVNTLPPTQDISGLRKALVIGNADYPAREKGINLFGPLSNPNNDAMALAKRLQGYGFTVTQVLNADIKTLNQAVNEFAKSLNKDDVALVYYSGHGVAALCNQKIGKINFLVPVGRKISNSAQLCDSTPADPVSTQSVLDSLSKRGGGSNILIFDACRQDLSEFEAKSFGSTGGFTEMQKTEGSFIGYATQPGATSWGSKGAYSRYTENLLAALSPPYDNQPMTTMFQYVRNVMAEAAVKEPKRRQIPWDINAMTGNFCFRSPCRSLTGRPVAIISERYQDHGDGTVVDMETGLMWKRCCEGQVWNGDVCLEDAQLETNSTSWQAFAGHDDWRVPTIKELSTLLVLCEDGSHPRIGVNGGYVCHGDSVWEMLAAGAESNYPSVDKTVFSNTPKSFFLTAPHSNNINYSEAKLSFKTGEVGTFSYGTPSYVRLVRGTRKGPL